MVEFIKDVQIRIATLSQYYEALDIAREEIYFGSTFLDIKNWMDVNVVSKVRNLYFPCYIAILRGTGEIVGMIQYEAQDIDYQNRQVVISINLLAIKNNFQGRGIGKKLVTLSLKKVIERWTLNKFTTVAVRVETDENRIVARKFYKKVLDKSTETILKDVWGRGEGTVIFVERLWDRNS